GKGGTGKTSCSTNVAGLAAAAGWRTLLIDLDSQGNCGHDLGYRWDGRGDNGDHLVTTLVAGGQLTPVLTDVRPNLDVICGGDRLDDLDDVVAGRERRGQDGRSLLRNALADLAGEYDLILVDTPPSRRSPLVLLALAAARYIVVPTKSDRASIEGLQVLGKQILDIRDTTNPDLEVLGAVLFDLGSSATVIRRNAAEDVNDALGGAAPLLEAVIRHAEQVAVQTREKGKLVHELAEVVHAAEPYWVALKEGRRPERVPGTAPALAEDYVLLAQEILNRINAAEQVEAKTA
ncbi:MAG: ParA family protein, partial [Nocardioidaceae bacterium]